MFFLECAPAVHARAPRLPAAGALERLSLECRPPEGFDAHLPKDRDHVVPERALRKKRADRISSQPLLSGVIPGKEGDELGTNSVGPLTWIDVGGFAQVIQRLPRIAG